MSQENTQIIFAPTTATTSGGNTVNPARTMRRCCFTINNYSTTRLQGLIDKFTEKNYLYIIGEEVAPTTGTRHLQGYVEFKTPRRFTTIKRLIGDDAHLASAKGSRKQNYEYCKKEGKFHSNLPLSLHETLLKEYENTEWYGWQRKVITLYDSEVSDRHIHWFVDDIGNSGKSYLTKYLYLKHNVLIGSGKKQDVFHQVAKRLDPDLPEPKTFKMVILDIPRHQQEFTNYGLLEELKNGIIMSGKYEGGTFVFPIPHVIVFSNSEPDQTKFSQDRWKIHRMGELQVELDMFGELADLLN